MVDTFSEAINRAMRYSLGGLNVCLPGQVTSYDYKTRKATVQPMIRQQFKDGETLEPPLISDVPVIFIGGGGATMKFPIKKGDKVLLIFADRNLESWLSSGAISNPNDPRAHSLNDCIAIPGLQPFNHQNVDENNDDVLIVYQDAKIRIQKNGSMTLETITKGPDIGPLPGQVLAGGILEINPNGNISLDVANNLTAQSASIAVSPGTVQITGALTINGIPYLAHTHAGVEPGLGISGPVVGL